MQLVQCDSWSTRSSAGLLACTDIVRLTREEYETVRASPVTFLVVPGHKIATDLDPRRH
jgi:hypothetical protein